MAFNPPIRNWQTSPVNGGWSLQYPVPERPGVTINAQGHTHTQVLDHVKRWRLNNGLPADNAGVFVYCNTIWCQRDPTRCLSTPALPDPPAGAGRRVLTPVDYGAHCWNFLATFGVNFGPILWIAAVNQVKQLINPQNVNNNGSGCEQCHAHFYEFNMAYPPQKVGGTADAAVWVWLAHDGANAWAAKPHRPTFRQAAALHGWPVLTDEQFAEIRARLLA